MSAAWLSNSQRMGDNRNAIVLAEDEEWVDTNSEHSMHLRISSVSSGEEVRTHNYFFLSKILISDKIMIMLKTFDWLKRSQG